MSESQAANPRREFAYLLHDVARLMRTRADQRAREVGMTRAQWVVLMRLDRCQGLKQSELAEMLDLQPITLTRLLDRLCENGLIERRPDPQDRRAKRLFLTPAARPLLDRLVVIGDEIMAEVLEDIDDAFVAEMTAKLAVAKTNLRRALDRKGTAELTDEQRYG